MSVSFPRDLHRPHRHPQVDTQAWRPRVGLGGRVALSPTDTRGHRGGETDLQQGGPRAPGASPPPRAGPPGRPPHCPLAWLQGLSRLLREGKSNSRASERHRRTGSEQVRAQRPPSTQGTLGPARVDPPPVCSTLRRPHLVPVPHAGTVLRLLCRTPLPGPTHTALGGLISAGGPGYPLWPG